MDFQIKLNIENAEEEISYLNDFIVEHDIDGLKTDIPEKVAQNGTMDGGILNDVLDLFITGSVNAVISLVFSAIGKFFDGKRADIELSYKCPDNGMVFTETYTFTSEKSREEIYKKFKKTIEKNCKKKIEILNP